MTTLTAPPPGAGQLPGRARGLLFVLCGALFLDALDISMMNVALPSMGADLDVSTRSLQWVVSSYVLGYGGFLLLGGRVADLLGRRRTFLVALAVFLAFSGLGGLAQDGTTLIVARFVTGVAAAFTAPAGLSIITTTFEEGPARTKALSVYTATGASGFALGLVAGGVLTELDWRLVFFVPVVVAAVVLAAALRLVPDDGRPERSAGGIDLAGALALTVGMLLLVFTLVEGPEVGWASGRSLATLAGAAASFTAFVAVERRVTAPLVRLGILRSASLVRANIGAMALLGGWLGTLFLATLYMQEARGWSALETGLAVFPAGPMVVLFAPLLGPALVARYGPGVPIVAGLTVHALAYALLIPAGLDTGYLALMPTFVLVGLGFALAYGPLSVAATAGITPGEQGLAGGLVHTSMQLGPALVLAVVTAVNDAHAGAGGTPEALLDGFAPSLAVPIGVALLGAAVVATGLRRSAPTPLPTIDPVFADDTGSFDVAMTVEPVAEAACGTC